MKLFQAVKDYVKKNPHVWYALLLPLYLIAFFIVERIVSSDSQYWASYIPLDDSIPFLEIFIIPYCMWYPLLVAVGLKLMLRDGAGFKKYMIYMMSGFFLTLAICLIIPNGQDLRPTEFERSNIFTWLVGRIYAADTNTNVFPSMHVVGSVAAIIATYKSPKMRRWRVPVLIIAILISISTVFVKQHSVLDIFGGLALCIPLYFCVYNPIKRRQKQ